MPRIKRNLPLIACLNVIVATSHGCNGPQGWNLLAQKPAASQKSAAVTSADSPERKQAAGEAADPKDAPLKSEVDEYVRSFDDSTNGRAGAAEDEDRRRGAAAELASDPRFSGSAERSRRGATQEDAEGGSDESRHAKRRSSAAPGERHELAAVTEQTPPPRRRSFDAPADAGEPDSADGSNGGTAQEDANGGTGEALAANGDGLERSPAANRGAEIPQGGPAVPAVLSMSVGAAPAAAADARRRSGSRANQPADVAGGSADRSADLAARIAVDPNDMDAQLRLRLRWLAEGDDARALAPTPGMMKDRAEMLTALVKMLISSRSQAGRDTAQWANRQLSEIRSLETMMRERADLQVPRVVMCRRTESFGVYDEITPAEFPAGRVNPVLAYVEVSNFRHEPSGNGFRSRLAARLAILDRAGQEVWSRREDRIEDESRNQRQDFFVSLDVAIPAALNPGSYTLKVSITDEVAGKTNENQTVFSLKAE